MGKRACSRREFLKVAAGAASGALLAGCAPTVVDEVTGETETVASPTSSGPVTITCLTRATDQSIFAEKAEAFNEQHSDIQVKLEICPTEEWMTKVPTRLAGGTLPDTIWGCSIYLFGTLAAKGGYADHSQFVEAQDVDLSQWYESAIADCSRDGTLYGLPHEYHPGQVGLFYNKDMFDAAGIDYPQADWTYEHLREVGEELTGGDQFGLKFTTNPYGIVPIIRNFGGDWLSDDGTECTLDTPEALECLQYLADLYNVYEASPFAAQMGDMREEQMMGANKLAMWHSGYWVTMNLRNYAPDMNWGATTIPASPDGLKGAGTAGSVSVTRNCKHPAEAFEWVKFNANKDNGRLSARAGFCPGARPDSWAMYEEEGMDAHQVFADALAQGVKRFHMPANTRNNEYIQAMWQGLDPLWLGEETDAAKVVADLKPELQAILDAPMP